MTRSTAPVAGWETWAGRAPLPAVQATRGPADALCMGVRHGFADVLFSKLADAPPQAACGWPIEQRIASPGWAHRLEPLRVVTARVLHQRYLPPASAAPAASGIPMVDDGSNPARGGSRAPSGATARRRTPREQVAIRLLNRLGANLGASATDEDVRRAYRALVRDAHPDRHQGAGVEALDAHASRLRAVVRAWAVFQGRGAAAA